MIYTDTRYNADTLKWFWLNVNLALWSKAIITIEHITYVGNMRKENIFNKSY